MDRVIDSLLGNSPARAKFLNAADTMTKKLDIKVRLLGYHRIDRSQTDLALREARLDYLPKKVQNEVKTLITRHPAILGQMNAALRQQGSQASQWTPQAVELVLRDPSHPDHTAMQNYLAASARGLPTRASLPNMEQHFQLQIADPRLRRRAIAAEKQKQQQQFVKEQQNLRNPSTFFGAN